MRLSESVFPSSSIHTDNMPSSIIKEHTTIQARAACDLSASRRTALSGTPLQNSLNDLYSLVRFLRLEPFTDRAVWTKHIGALAKNGDDLGVSRLQLIMRHLTLRRTKNSVDKDGVPILDLPPNTQTIVHLTFDPAEHAFYSSHHNRYKHDFKKLEETDSVMKNYCSILQELLRLRQICVHTALVQDSEDVAGGSGDLIKMIEQHGISKPRAIQLLSLMRDAGGAQCCECGTEILAVGDAGEEEEEKKPAKKSRKVVKSASAPASAAASEDESGGIELRSVITRCQHLFCRDCFRTKVCSSWPNKVKSEEKATCTVCKVEMTPALDAVEIGARELEKALDEAAEGVSEVTVGKKKGKKATRIFEHSTKTKCAPSLFASS
jgi:SWI/SNF-related matrix-associated actin-dependent regulator of chromatin subfamily A3